MRTFLFSLVAFVTFIPAVVFAQEDDNKNLVNLPIGDTDSFNDYINAVYLMFISIAALIAVVKIIIAGVKYMFSDIVTQKSDAKRDIQGALLGLLVVLSAVVVLTIINPDLTTFDPDITGIDKREAAELPIKSYTEISYDGKKEIPTTAPTEAKKQFILGCNGKVITLGGKMICHELSDGAKTKIEKNLRDGSNPVNDELLNIIIEQYQFHLGVEDITNQETLNEIGTELEVDSVLFAVAIQSDEETKITQAEGICKKYAEANGDTSQNNIMLAPPTQTQKYAACVKINN